MVYFRYQKPEAAPGHFRGENDEPTKQIFANQAMEQLPNVHPGKKRAKPGKLHFRSLEAQRRNERKGQKDIR